MLTGALAAAIALILRTGSLSYALALAWGLGGIYVANAFAGAPLISYAAIAGAAPLAIAVIIGWLGRTRLARRSLATN